MQIILWLLMPTLWEKFQKPGFFIAHGISLSSVPADWKRYGKRAGPLRNTEIVRQADMVIAFWDGRSRGTRNTIDKALRAGKSVRIFSCGERNAEA